MGLGIEAVLGYNGSLTSDVFEPLTPNANQSFQVRNFTAGTAYLEEIWAADSASSYTVSVKSPKMHDNVYGILLAGNPLDAGGNASFNPQALMSGYAPQVMYATDTPTFTALGTTDDVFNALFLMYYTNIGGINARLFNWATVQPLIDDFAGVSVTAESSGTAGNYGASSKFNSGLYNLRANDDYAILGYTVNKPCTAVTLNGIDTGNLQLGGPGYWDTQDGAYYFVRLSNIYGLPHIPVINANNAAITNVNVAALATSTEYTVTFLCAHLTSRLGEPAGL